AFVQRQRRRAVVAHTGVEPRGFQAAASYFILYSRHERFPDALAAMFRIDEQVEDPRLHPALDPVNDVSRTPADEDAADRTLAAPRDQVEEVSLLLEFQALAMSRWRSIG